MSQDADQLAKACPDSMWANNQASNGLGMQIDKVEQGFAQLSMSIRKDMLNGQEIGHGGFIFTLADSAFAFACNTYNQFTVAQHCSVSFLAPVYLNDRLTATAVERNRTTRSGIYDVTVVNQKGDTVAEFRGHSRTVKGQHIPDL